MAALLAYGNVRQIRRSVEDLLGRMRHASGSPSLFVEQISQTGQSESKRALSGFIHRFNRGEDVAILLELVARSWREYGSLGAHFISYLEPVAPDFSEALNALIRDWRRWAGPKALKSSFSYFLTAPADGSCCKRWCMFLRWMGREDAELDLGLWGAKSPFASGFPGGRFLKPSQLIVPLDTHTGRISQYLGLTRRKSIDWKTALEVTGALRRCDPDDPTRYDFALARLGILDLCERRYRAEVCQQCMLLPVCRFSRRREKLVRSAHSNASACDGSSKA